MFLLAKQLEKSWGFQKNAVSITAHGPLKYALPLETMEGSKHRVLELQLLLQ